MPFHSNQWVLTLRTEIPLDAVKRSAALLTVYETEGQKIVGALKNNLLVPADAKSLLMEGATMTTADIKA